MKLLVSVSLLTVALSLFAYSEHRRSQLLEQQLADYDKQVAQLLTQIENRSLEAIAVERRLRTLENEVDGRDNQIAALSRQLETAQQQIDPDFERIEQQMRQQIRREMQASSNAASLDPRTSLIRQLAEFDPQEMGELMSLHSQYGPFIDGLDISEERMEVVINALSNMITEQNELRRQIGQEMRGNPDAINRSEFRERMQAINDPSAQIEALSYELSDSELDAFREFQEQRNSSYNPFFIRSADTATSISTGSTQGFNFFSTDVIEVSPGPSRAIQLQRAEPPN